MWCYIVHAMDAGNVPCKSADIPVFPSGSCVQMSTSVCLTMAILKCDISMSVCLTMAILKCDISSPRFWHEPMVLGFPLQRTHRMSLLIDFLGECKMGLSKMSIKNNWFAIKINELSNSV